MADNLTTQTTLSTVPSGTGVATDEVTYSGDTGRHIAPSSLVVISGAEGSKTATPVPAGGGAEANALRVTIASDSTGVLSIDDNGGSVTIDGTVGVSGTVTVDSELPAAAALADNAANPTAPAVGAFNMVYDGAAWDRAPGTTADGLLVNLGANNDVTVTGTVTVGSHAVTNAGTFAVQESGAALTALQLIDNLVLAEDAAHVTADPGVQVLAVRKATPANVSGTDGDYEPLQVSAGRLWASATIDAALPAGTANIGDVDVLTVPTPLSTTGNGTAATALRVTVASDSTGVIDTELPAAAALADNAANPTAPAVGAFNMVWDGATWDRLPGTAADGVTVNLGANNDVTVTGTVTVGSHAVTNAGTFATQVDGAALTALQLIDNLVLAEDAPHVSGDPGVLAFAVRKDAAGTLASLDGDNTPLQTDSAGSLRVVITGGAGSGGTSAADESGYTPATSAGTPIMGAADETAPDAAAEGTLAIIRSTLSRALHVNLRDAAGAEVSVGGGTQYTEDAAAAADPVGTAQMMVRQDTLSATTVSADGDNIAARAASTGAQYVEIAAGTTKLGNATDGLLVNLGANNDVTVTSGTVTANLAAGTNNVGDVDIETFENSADVTMQNAAVATGNGTVLTTTGYGTATLQVTGTFVGTITFEGTANGTDYVSVSANTLGATTIGTTTTGTGIFRIAVAGLTNIRARISAYTSGSITVLGRATNAPHFAKTTTVANAVTLAALPAGTNNIGDVDVLTVPAPLSTTGNGTAATALRVTLASDTTGVIPTVTTVSTVSTLTGGGVAHDGADSGNPIKIGAKAKATLEAVTAVAADDRTDLYADLNGALIVRPHAPLGDLLSERVSDTGGTSTAFSTFGAPGAGVRNYITAITVHNAHATTAGFVDIRDGAAGSVLWTIPAPPTGGATLMFNPPLRQPTANTALAYDVSAAITTVYISIAGFQANV